METYLSRVRACRVCREHDQGLFKYGPRHYAHAACGLKQFGDEFLEKLPVHEVKNLPYKALEENGWPLKRIQMYVEKRERDGLTGSVRRKRK